MGIKIAEVLENTAGCNTLLVTAEELNQAKYISFKKLHHLESILLGANGFPHIRYCQNCHQMSFSHCTIEHSLTTVC
jgi:hypothetical protein